MTLTKPQKRTLVLHVVTFSGGAFAAISFAASKSVDLYAAYDHLYSGVQEIMAAWAILLPIASGAYAVYRATTKGKILDILSDPKAPEIAAGIPPTPKVVEVAEALRKQP